MDSLDEIRKALVALKLRLGRREIDAERYRALREELLADLSPGDRSRLGSSGTGAASPAPFGPSEAGGQALRTQPPALSELDLRPGTVLFGQWQIGRELGRGGFGVVFEAEELLLGQQQAVKILDPAMVARAELLGRFRREVRMMRALHHRHIVRVFDYREEADRYLALISMELVAAGSLARLLAALPPRSLPVPTVLRVLRQILDALAAAHEAGVMHRDITPANVLLAGGERLREDFGADPGVRLVDFGIAGMIEKSELSAKSQVLGTAAYVAPEVLDPRADITPAVDIYGAGAIAYEMLAGQVPLVTGYKQLERLRPDLGRGLAELVHGMIAADPAERLDIPAALERLDRLGAPGTAQVEIPPPTAGPPAATPVPPIPATPVPALPPVPVVPPWPPPSALPPVAEQAASPAAADTDAAASVGRTLLKAGGMTARLLMLAAAAFGIVVFGLIVFFLMLFSSVDKPPQEETTSAAPPLAGLDMQLYQVEIRSDVKDDEVTIDFTSKGPTPVVENLPAGRYRIEVSRSGCQNYVQVVEVKDAVKIFAPIKARCWH